MFIVMFLTQKKQRLELFFKMEAANQLKRQEANRKESIDMGISKNVDNVNSPSYDAELNAATASIISLPVDTSSPIITTHGDVSLFIRIRLKHKDLIIIPSRLIHQQVDNCISSMKFSPSTIKLMIYDEQLVKFSVAFDETSRFKSCTRMSFNRTRS